MSREPEKALFVTSRRDVERLQPGYSVLYYGDSFCRDALPTPDELRAAAAAARKMSMRLCLVVPYLTNDGLRDALKLAELLAGETDGAEVAANDPGFIAAAAARLPSLKFAADRVFARQKTDPRIQPLLERRFTGAELEKRRAEMRCVATAQPATAAFLKNIGVSRIELQPSPAGIDVPDDGFHYSLHVPFAFLSSTRFCLPREQYVAGPRVHSLAHPCRRWCADRYYRLRSRADGLTLYYRGTTIFTRFDPPEIPPRVDRVVYHTDPS